VLPGSLERGLREWMLPPLEALSKKMSGKGKRDMPQVCLSCMVQLAHAGVDKGCAESVHGNAGVYAFIHLRRHGLGVHLGTAGCGIMQPTNALGGVPCGKGQMGAAAAASCPCDRQERFALLPATSLQTHAFSLLNICTCCSAFKQGPPISLYVPHQSFCVPLNASPVTLFVFQPTVSHFVCAHIAG
jgi:hypothetical protein